ncbi:MAG: M28 family peptidase, partial [Gemmatimonadota bacterium]
MKTALAVLFLNGAGWAQTGFTETGAVAQRAAEEAVLAAIAPADLEAMARKLSARPHVAGTPGQAAFADTLAAWLRSWGLGLETPRYDVFLPHATAVSVALVASETLDLALVERPIPDDAATAYPQYPWVNGYAAPGIAEAEVVYANHGLHDDYALLDSLGIGVAGKIVLARYGRSYRGVKARLAGEHGAAALVLYSDPLDDGYVQGDLYPVGPFRPWDGIQRGSVLDGIGDPATPAGPSTSGAPREPPRGLPAIPVIPVSYEAAAEILERIGGADLPRQEWQGGLPFRYHVGPGPARVRVIVDDDRDDAARGIKEVRDVLGRIEGRELPDEWVILGAHIDAWGPGAADNVSGTVSVWAAARALAQLAAAGQGPRRTVIFAGWDGEEWGLIGSTEWVEEHAAELASRAVA